VRYRFKGIVRSTGQTVEGHAHGESPEDALQALSEHGIVTESLREEPEPLNLNAEAQPLSSAIDSALDTAASQVPFDSIEKKFKGKNVWVLDRDKIRKRVAQVVDQAIRNSLGDSGQFGALDVQGLRKQVADAIGGLFKDNRNLTSQVSNTSVHLEHQVLRIESMVRRAESVYDSGQPAEAVITKLRYDAGLIGFVECAAKRIVARAALIQDVVWNIVNATHWRIGHG